MKKNKKKIIIGIISILIIILLIVGILIFLKPKKELNENKNSKHQATQATIELIDNLEVEINSEVNLLSFIKNNNNLEIVSNDEKVDTSILGEKELIIKYKEQNEEKEYKFNIKIKDTIAPSIEYKEELSTTVGTKIDLLKDVKVSDNSLEEIKATVEGKYDIDKEGTYNLKYVAVDSSNNRVEEEFTLKVNKKTAKKTTTSKSNTPSSSKKPAENINPDKEWVDFDLATEYGETTDYKYGTKLSEVKEYFILKYSDNTEEKVYAGSTYKIDSKNYNGNTKVLLSEATAIVDRNLSVQNEMLKYVNDYRAEKGAEPLSIDRNLSIAATVRALEIAYASQFSHTRPDGSDCYTVFDDLGIQAGIKGENLTASVATAKAAAGNWRNSSVHYSNMINTSFKKIGIGSVYVEGSVYSYYWVQLFSN